MHSLTLLVYVNRLNDIYKKYNFLQYLQKKLKVIISRKIEIKF